MGSLSAQARKELHELKRAMRAKHIDPGIIAGMA